MCTLTWTALAADGAVREDGYSLWFNRDESLTRGPEKPPREQVAPGGTRYLAPEDSEAGGTWITVNEHGVTVALLNGYVNTSGPELNQFESRGALVRGLADVRHSHRAMASLSPHSLRVYRPAVLFIKPPKEPALVARWDGRTVSIDLHGERQLPLTSSSYAQDEVQLARRALYEELVHGKNAGHGTRLNPNPERLEAYQRYVDPEGGPSAHTPTMLRSDAATRSQCRIRVTPDDVRFDYVPGPPHQTEVSTSLRLERISAL